jgi:hypothetical protein
MFRAREKVVHVRAERDNGVQKAEVHLGQKETGGSGKGGGERERDTHACTEFPAHEEGKLLFHHASYQE